MIRIKLDPRLALFITVFCLLTIAPMGAFAADISVNGSTCTLADAIAAANIDSAVAGCSAGSGADSISISGNITLSAALPVITSDITIEGAGNSVSGNDQYQVFVVEGGSLTLNRLTVTNGLSATTGGAIYVANEGSLRLNNSKVLNSVGNDSGGGVYSNNSDVSLSESEIGGNTTSRSHGGGVYFVSTTDDHILDIKRSYFRENTAIQDGGAVYLSGGGAEILKSSFFNNVADEGGALEINSAVLVVTNSTFGYNSAREGGGLSAFASNISLLHTTWAYNSAKEQGGSLALIGEDSSLSILNTIISNSPSGGDCHSGLAPDQIIANTSNIIEDGSCPLLSAGDKPPAESQAAAEADDGGELLAEAQSADDDSSAPADDDGAAQSADDDAVGDDRSADDDSAADDAAAQSADEDSEADQLQAQQDDPPPAPAPVDPKLRAQTGWPPHFPLQSDSPAMNAADDGLCESLELDEDQPGTTRPQGEKCEIGAWEAPTPEPPEPTEVPEPEPIPEETPVPLPPPDEDPPSEACLHIVAAGETLFGLALRYNTTVEDFRRFNQLETDSLSVGQSLLVPVENCDPDPYICVTPANVYVLSASGYVECADINTNRIDKHPALANGMLMAVEIRGYVNTGSEVCFPSAGNIVFLDTITSPPIVSTLATYNRSGLVCSQIDRPGIAVLVSSVPLGDTAQAEAVLPSFDTGISRELSDCVLTTTEVTQLLDAPGDGAVAGLIPFASTMTAHERTADQFGVTFLDRRGWVNAAQVSAQGDCE